MTEVESDLSAQSTNSWMNLILIVFPWLLLVWVAYRHLKPLANPNHSTLRHEISPGPSFMRNKQGLWLYTHTWLPPSGTSVSGVVFYAHGFGGHVQRQWELAEYFTSRGFVCVGLDHQGFGRSEGDRGHVESFTDYVDDYSQFIDKVLSTDLPQYADLPLFLVGSSMGGNIAIQLANKRPHFFNGIVLLAPAIAPHRATVSPWMVYAARVMSHYLPKLIPFPAAPWRSNPDTDVVNCYVSDPLSYTYPYGMRARWGWEMLRAMQSVSSTLDKVEWPFIVLQGTQDVVTNAEGCELLYKNAQSQDKTYRELEGWAHALIDEPRRQDLYREMFEWLSQRTGKSKTCS